MGDESERRRLAEASRAEQDAFVIAAVLADPVAAAVLDRADQLGAPDWGLTAGAVYQNVWNALTRQPGGTGVRDYDLAYCDIVDLSWEAEDAVIRRAAAVFGDLGRPVEVRNQARVHLWFEDKYGEARAPLSSIEAALKGYAAPAHMAAIRRGVHGDLEVLAPRGLHDVFDMVIRPSRPAAYTADLIAKTERMKSVLAGPATRKRSVTVRKPWARLVNHRAAAR
jgi:hypothetical protein